MYLRKLSLHGFKAFAGTQEFDFTSGTTAIIGPNGSGKSNVADAIRWVFGEQSNKNIRAKKTEDVIFFGSDTRRSMGLAEVTVVLDNEDKWLPLDFAEVSITRRAHRSGDNEYLINGKKVRHGDVLALLNKANMHQNSYAFVSQGLADKIIELKPFERRTLIEEAANIDQFRRDLVLTNRRIDEARSNILKIDLILKELKPRVKFYERFQKKIVKHKELSLELNFLLNFFYSAKFNILNRHKNSFIKSINGNNNLIEDHKKNVNKLAQQITELDLIISNVESKKSVNRTEYNKVTDQMILADKEYALITQKEIDYKSREKSIQDDLNNLNNMQYPKKVSASPDNINILNLDKGNFIKEKTILLKSQASFNHRKSELINIRNASQVNLDKQFSELNNARENVFNCEKAIREVELELSLLDQFYKDAPVNSDNINDLLNQMSNINNINERPNILGPLTRLIQVPPEYERAIEASLIAYLNAIIVSNINDAKKCFKYLQENDLGSARLLILDQVPSSPGLTLMKEKGIIGIASKLVKVDGKYQDLIDALLGKTIIVENFDKAKEVLSRGIGQVVTIDGTLFINNYNLYGGSNKSSGKHFSIQERLLELNSDLENEQKKIPSLKNALINTEKIISEIRKVINDSDQEIRQIEIDATECNVSINKINDSLAAINAELGFIENPANINKDTEQAVSPTSQDLANEKQSELISIAENIKQNQNKSASLNVDIVSLNSKKESINNDFKLINDEHLILKNNSQKLHDDSSRIEKEIHSLENTGFQLTNKQEQNNFELNDLLDKLKQDELSLNDDGSINNSFFIEPSDMLNLQSKYEAFINIDIEDSLLESNLKSVNLIANDMRVEILKLGSLDEEIESDLKQDKERYDTLVNQTEDLINSEDELRTIINRLEYSITEKFSTTFDLVNDKFNYFFREVFDGGSAELKLINAEQKSDAGIEIIVKPPGKRLSNLSALSGGERAMTSVALMFALMSVNPSPICVLDEVDAALDDANIKRFLRILNELSQKSQFIVITHNRITVQDAETVYGVSMEQDATSTVLSLKIKDLVN
ncbi:MAG: AAA family ATPase [Dehalococcoidia bacterium]|nr:AAA family ATPase [Dehalococcoidia bacterium]